MPAADPSIAGPVASHIANGHGIRVYEFDFGRVNATGPNNSGCLSRMLSAAVSHGLMSNDNRSERTMRPSGFIQATFAVAPHALPMIERLRADAEKASSEPIGAVGLAWRHFQLVDTIERIAFSTPDQAKELDRRVIDLSKEKWFFVAIEPHRSRVAAT
jgi:hypothetical protein